MLYICIPTYNEAPTVGLLLWRIRRVFQDYSREYEIVVYDDASTDSTAATLEPYKKVIPLTVIGGTQRRGYGHAIGALCREVAARTRYPRRDAMIVMQADFTDQPEQILELHKRFEGGADIVTTGQDGSTASGEVRRLGRLAGWIQKLAMPRSASAAGAEAFTSFRCYRISVLRELIKTLGDAPIVTTDGWAANAELLLRATPFARKVEKLRLEKRYDLRPRPSRLRPLPSALGIYRVARSARRLLATGS